MGSNYIGDILHGLNLILWQRENLTRERINVNCTQHSHLPKPLT